MDSKLDIRKEFIDDLLIMYVGGRIDSYWSEHLSNSIKEEIHSGNYNIELNLSQVTFISSIGIRIFLQYFRQLGSLGGSLSLTEISENVANVLKMSGMLEIFAQKKTAHQKGAKIEKDSNKASISNKTLFEIVKDTGLGTEVAGFSLECQFLSKGVSLDSKIFGNAVSANSFNISEKGAIFEKAEQNTYLFGLGALGNNFSDCRERFGEAMALAGAAMYHPTDGTNKPDFSLSVGNFVPEICLAYGIKFAGAFERLYKFDCKEKSVGIQFNKLLQSVMFHSNYKKAGFVVLAQATGLVGATLSKRPEALAKEGAIFKYPEIVDNIAFTAERAWPRSLAVITGVAEKIGSADNDFKGLTRKISNDSDIFGHFHAAIFPFLPLKKDVSDIAEIIRALLENAQPVSIMHLLNDDRPLVGAGDSELTQGYCWCGEISDAAK